MDPREIFLGGPTVPPYARAALGLSVRTGQRKEEKYDLSPFSM